MFVVEKEEVHEPMLKKSSPEPSSSVAVCGLQSSESNESSPPNKGDRRNPNQRGK